MTHPVPTEAIGSQSRIITKEESVWGVNPGGSDWKGLRFRPGAGLATEIAEHIDESIDPSRAIQFVRGGKKTPGGEIPVSFAPEGYCTFIKHCLGGTPQTTGSAPYTHIVKGDTAFPVGGLAIEVGFVPNSFYFLFLGCRVNAFTLEIPVDDIITATFAILAREESYSTSSQDAAVTLPTVQPYVSHEMKLYEAAGLTEIAEIVAATFTVSNNAEEACLTAPSRFRYDIPPLTRDVQGTLTLLFNSVTLYNKFMDETESVARIKLLAANGYYSQFDFPKIKYVGGSPTPAVETAGPIQVEYPFRAIYDDTEETDIKYTSVNGWSSI